MGGENLDNDSENDDRFVQAMAQNQRSLLAFIVGLTPSMADADDILQEVNLAIWKKRRLYDWNQSFLRWAFGFAGIEIRRFREKQASKRLWANDSVLESLAEACPTDSTLVEQRRDALSGCVSKLGPLERRMITEFYARQQSAKDLSDVTGRSLRNVYKILTRARQALRVCVDRTLAQQSRPTH